MIVSPNQYACSCDRRRRTGIPRRTESGAFFNRAGPKGEPHHHGTLEEIPQVALRERFQEWVEGGCGTPLGPADLNLARVLIPGRGEERWGYVRGWLRGFGELGALAVAGKWGKKCFVVRQIGFSLNKSDEMMKGVMAIIFFGWFWGPRKKRAIGFLFQGHSCFIKNSPDVPATISQKQPCLCSYRQNSWAMQTLRPLSAQIAGTNSGIFIWASRLLVHDVYD